MKNDLNLTMVDCIDLWNIIQNRIDSLTSEDIFFGEFGKARLNKLKDKFDTYIMNNLGKVKEEIYNEEE